MIRFSLFGIPIQVHPFFWITLALIGGALDANSSEAIFRLGLFLLAGFISVLVHELGHALTARHFGAYTQIVLQAFGGYASYTGVRMTRTQSFLITAAGPAIQIALGLIVWFLMTQLPGLNPNMGYFLFMLMWISIIWAVINLLPVLPLDGGQMLSAILGPQRIRITLWITIVVSIIAAVLMFRFMGSYLFAIFLGFFAWQAWKALQETR
jgi:Zn-dependent protease